MSLVARKWLSFYLASLPGSEIQSYITTYEYGRLLPGTRSFRVFHLFPQQAGDLAQRDDLSGVLRGRIELVNLDDPNGHCYNALSYCWEGSIEPSPYLDQRKDRIIIEALDGSTSQVAISPALSTALRYLRAQGQSLPLFVDQICINQADDAEKSHQINLMGDIYRSCECVLAWLDVATKHTDALFHFLPRISDNEFLRQLSRNLPRSSDIIRAAMERRSDFSDDATLGQDVADMINLTRDHWGCFPRRGFLDICLRRWFRRIWIVQEACLGRKMVFVCGRQSCSVEALEVANEFNKLASDVMHLEGARNPLHHLPAKWDREAMHLSHMSSVVVFRIFQERAAALGPSGDDRGENMRRGLLNIVNRFNVDVMAYGPWVRLGSSNPKDYIYAFKGLVTAGDTVSEQLPGYDRPAAAIFTGFTHSCLGNSTELPPIDTLLLSRTETKKVEGLPTWVPDWSTYLGIPHGYAVGYFPLFNAGGGLREPYTPAEVEVTTPGILRVKAVLLCKVDGVGTRFMELSSRRLGHQLTPPRIMPRSIFDAICEIQQMCEWAANRPNSASIPSTAGLEEAVWLTTTGGHGLTQTTERTLLGRPTEDGRPLLGYLWDFHQLQMDVLTAIMKTRRGRLASIGDTWTANTRQSAPSGVWFLSRLLASFEYWRIRLVVESLHLYRLWKYACGLPYVLLRRESEDTMYPAVFGVQMPEISMLKFVLERHVRRKCFVSDAGHVGLGPVEMQLGDAVVVPLGATAPFILRPGAADTEPWTYVGEAYCHRFMDGEALADGNGLEVRQFEIR